MKAGNTTEGSWVRLLVSPSGAVWSNGGFTLIELLAVTAIIAILATLAFPLYTEVKDKARRSRAMAEIRALETGVNAYSVDKGGGYPASLNDIIQAPPLDPWGTPYRYTNIVTDGVAAALKDQTGAPCNDDFDLYSKGPDKQSNLLLVGQPTSVDDIIRSGDGGYVGPRPE